MSSVTLQSTTPTDYEELIRVIHERYEEMSKSYQKIALYLTQNPNDVAVLDSDGTEILTLVTCYPFYFVGSAPERFIVRAERVALAG